MVYLPACFLAFPATGDFEAMRHLIEEILEEANARIITTDEASFRSSYTGDVAEAIERADFVIGEVTDGNPNVLFQLGIAYGMRKRILALSQKGGAKAPVEINGLRTIFYRPGDVDTLRYFLLDWLHGSMSKA